MAAVWPDVLWDVAFEGFERWVARWLPQNWARRISGPVGEFFLLTLAAQWATLPVVVWHFRRISLISPVANLLVLPAQTPLMVIGGLALVVSGIWRPLGEVLAWMAWPWAAYTIRVAETLARVPWASVAVERTWVLLIHGGLWVWLEGRRFWPRLPVSLPAPSRWAWIAGLWALNAARRLRRWLTKARTPIDTLSPGGWLDLGAGGRLEVHATTDGGSALRLSWQRFTLPLHFGDVPSLETRDTAAKPEVPFSLHALPGLTESISTRAGPITEIHLVTDGREVWLTVHSP